MILSYQDILGLFKKKSVNFYIAAELSGVYKYTYIICIHIYYLPQSFQICSLRHPILIPTVGSVEAKIKNKFQ